MSNMNVTVTKLGNGRTAVTINDGECMDTTMIQETEYPGDEYDSWMEDAEIVKETSIFELLGIWEQGNQIMTFDNPTDEVLKDLRKIVLEALTS